MTRDELVLLLNSNLVEIKFISAEGENKTILGTLREDLIPPEHRRAREIPPSMVNPIIELVLSPSPESQIKQPPRPTVSLWSPDRQGWRTLRPDRIQSITIKETP